MVFSVRPAQVEDFAAVAAMAGCIWHSATLEQLQSEFLEMTGSAEAAIFLACDEKCICGFAQCSLRHDYVEGTHSSPVEYLEGIYVAPEYRRQGCAGALLAACEGWAKEQNCTEFASDCELANAESLLFHLNLGFQETNRIICFSKKL